MQYIVQKYGGELKFAQEDGTFTLDMMFTIPEMREIRKMGSSWRELPPIFVYPSFFSTHF